MTAAGRPARDGISIGAVLTALRPDFPDVTISKIRFLESEGLVRPGRTPSGYRQFSQADVDRLRFVLAAQRDHYLPLKVIREQLDATDRGARPRPTAVRPSRGLAPVRQDPALPTAAEFAGAAEKHLSREEFLDQADIEAGTLHDLEQYGLVRQDQHGRYDGEAVLVARTVRAMTEFGIEPRHLRAFRASADREVGLLEQIVAPMYRQRGPDSRARADDVARQLAALSVSLHTLLVKAGLRQVTGQ